MKEVARVAGVSLATVSRVVNGTGEVRDDLAERVNEAVRMLGYRRDLTASTLRRADRQSASIGLIIEDVSNPFFSAVHRGVEDVARPHGVLTFVGSSDEQPERERELAETFGARGVRAGPSSTCSPPATRGSRSWATGWTCSPHRSARPATAGRSADGR
jgi:LacI family transcriptional regulator